MAEFTVLPEQVVSLSPTAMRNGMWIWHYVSEVMRGHERRVVCDDHWPDGVVEAPLLKAACGHQFVGMPVEAARQLCHKPLIRPCVGCAKADGRVRRRWAMVRHAPVDGFLLPAPLFLTAGAMPFRVEPFRVELEPPAGSLAELW